MCTRRQLLALALGAFLALAAVATPSKVKRHNNQTFITWT
jgi:hypothetical protein